METILALLILWAIVHWVRKSERIVPVPASAMATVPRDGMFEVDEMLLVLDDQPSDDAD